MQREFPSASSYMKFYTERNQKRNLLLFFAEKKNWCSCVCGEEVRLCVYGWEMRLCVQWGGALVCAGGERDVIRKIFR